MKLCCAPCSKIALLSFTESSSCLLLGEAQNAGGNSSYKSPLFGRAGSASGFYTHCCTAGCKNKSECCFPEKHFSWQKSVADKIELATQAGTYLSISLDTFKTKMCFDTCRMSKMGLRRKAAITLCWCSTEGEVERITNELVSQRLETF